MAKQAKKLTVCCRRDLAEVFVAGKVVHYRINSETDFVSKKEQFQIRRLLLKLC